MLFAAIGNVRDLIEIAVAAISVLGGSMAACSGAAARRSVIGEEPTWKLTNDINRGLAQGFGIGLPLAVIAAILLILF